MPSGTGKKTCMRTPGSLDLDIENLKYGIRPGVVLRPGSNHIFAFLQERIMEKVMEIIVFLMKHMQDEKGRFNDIADVSQTLVGHGYTQQEVNTAFAWLFDRLQAQAEIVVDPTKPLQPKPNRILHAVEQLMIQPDAYGYLLELRELGLITDTQTELIIERAMLTGARSVTRDDIKTIAAPILLESESGQVMIWLPDDLEEGIIGN
ncbi:MAG: DUF494 domain-containing protein [Gemmatimonadetes bacterium]|nr:DUF494 domain-containing protein [Gemmatimonadota bacterium]